MKLETAQLLMKQSPHLGLILDFSARYADQCGEKTAAVSGDYRAIRDAVCLAAFDCGRTGNEAAFQDLRELRWDSFGREAVAY